MTKYEFSEAVTRHEKKLYIAALAIVKNTEDAKDAVANAVAKAWEKLGSLKDPEKFDAWLLKITLNEAKTIHRRRREYQSLDEIQDVFAYGSDGESIEFFDLIANAGLDRTSMKIIMLRFFYCYDLPQTAKMLGIPLSTVKTKYYRALDKLKDTPGIKQ